MTYLEKLSVDHPDMAARGKREGLLLCPSDLGYEEYEPDEHCEKVGGCKKCWAREMTEDEE